MSPVTKGLVTKALNRGCFTSLRRAFEREMPREQAKHAARKTMRGRA